MTFRWNFCSKIGMYSKKYLKFQIIQKILKIWRNFVFFLDIVWINFVCNMVQTYIKSHRVIGYRLKFLMKVFSNTITIHFDCFKLFLSVFSQRSARSATFGAELCWGRDVGVSLEAKYRYGISKNQAHFTALHA